MSKVVLQRAIREMRSDEAIWQAVTVHGVPVRTLAKAMGMSRQTVYRRMKRARWMKRRRARLAIQKAEAVAAAAKAAVLTVSRESETKGGEA